MKKFIFAMVLFVLLLACGLWYQSTLRSFAQEIADYCDAIERLVYAKDIPALEEKIEEFEDYWEGKEKTMSYFVDHVHLNSMTKSIGELKMAIRADETVDMLMANSRVKKEAETIALDELLRPENIL